MRALRRSPLCVYVSVSNLVFRRKCGCLPRGKLRIAMTKRRRRAERLRILLPRHSGPLDSLTDLRIISRMALGTCCPGRCGRGRLAFSSSTSGRSVHQRDRSRAAAAAPRACDAARGNWFVYVAVSPSPPPCRAERWRPLAAEARVSPPASPVLAPLPCSHARRGTAPGARVCALRVRPRRASRSTSLRHYCFTQIYGSFTQPYFVATTRVDATGQSD